MSDIADLIKNPFEAKVKPSEQLAVALYALLYKVYDAESGVLKTNAVLNGDATFDTTGLATSAKQDSAKTVLDNILAKITADPATQTTLAAVLAKLSSDPATQTTLAALVSANHTDLAAILTKLSASIAVTGTFWQATQPVSVASLPLPSSAATAAKQDDIKGVLDTISTNTPASAQRTPAIATATGSGTVSSGKRKVTFIFSADFTGTVLSAAFNGNVDSQLQIDAPAGDTLAAIAYTVTNGNVKILTV